MRPAEAAKSWRVPPPAGRPESDSLCLNWRSMQPTRHLLQRLALLCLRAVSHRAPMWRDVLVAMTAVLSTLAAVRIAERTRDVHLTTLGRAKTTGERAFVLAVNLQFQDNASAQSLLREWESAAKYCIANEPFLFAYEVAQSDQDPMKYVILERYRSKEDYTGAHRRSPAFKTFRPHMRKLQTSGAVTVTGASYRELGIGFT